MLDATTGQNGLAQAKAFHEAVGLTGIVLTKLDSTAKGGIVFAIEDALGIPVRFVGVGEAVGDLIPFDPDAFVAALFASSRRLAGSPAPVAIASDLPATKPAVHSGCSVRQNSRTTRLGRRRSGPPPDGVPTGPCSTPSAIDCARRSAT